MNKMMRNTHLSKVSAGTFASMNSTPIRSFQRYSPEIRFADIDAVGMVNNAVFLTYFEQSRIHFFQGIVNKSWNWNDAGMVVARHEINYMLPVKMNDEMEIWTWMESIGSKSLNAEYEVRVKHTGQWHVAAKAKSVLVAFDHVNGQSIPWPKSWIRSLENVGFGRPEGLDTD